MKQLSLTTTTSILILYLSISCHSKMNTEANRMENPRKSHSEEVNQAFESIWDFVNNEDLSDSIVFNKFLSFFADDFQTIGKEGSAPDDMKGTFDWLRGYVKTHKPNIDIEIDKVDASEDFAYFLFRYRESFREKETDKITIDVMHSAVMIFRKNEQDVWKCALWKFT